MQPFTLHSRLRESQKLLSLFWCCFWTNMGQFGIRSNCRAPACVFRDNNNANTMGSNVFSGGNIMKLILSHVKYYTRVAYLLFRHCLFKQIHGESNEVQYYNLLLTQWSFHAWFHFSSALSLLHPMLRPQPPRSKRNEGEYLQLNQSFTIVLFKDLNIFYWHNFWL